MHAGGRAFFPKKRQLREESIKLQYDDLKVTIRTRLCLSGERMAVVVAQAKGGAKAVQTKLRRLREKKRRKLNKKRRAQMPRSR